MDKIHQSYGRRKQVGVAILISDKIDITVVGFLRYNREVTS